LTPEKRIDPVPFTPENNGGPPCFVKVREGGGHHLFGPYKKDFAEHLAETFDGMVVDSSPIIITEKIEIKKDDNRE